MPPKRFIPLSVQKALDGQAKAQGRNGSHPHHRPTTRDVPIFDLESKTAKSSQASTDALSGWLLPLGVTHETLAALVEDEWSSKAEVLAMEQGDIQQLPITKGQKRLLWKIVDNAVKTGTVSPSPAVEATAAASPQPTAASPLPTAPSPPPTAPSPPPVAASPTPEEPGIELYDAGDAVAPPAGWPDTDKLETASKAPEEAAPEDDDITIQASSQTREEPISLFGDETPSNSSIPSLGVPSRAPLDGGKDQKSKPPISSLLGVALGQTSIGQIPEKSSTLTSEAAAAAATIQIGELLNGSPMVGATAKSASDTEKASSDSSALNSPIIIGGDLPSGSNAASSANPTIGDDSKSLPLLGEVSEPILASDKDSQPLPGIDEDVKSLPIFEEKSEPLQVLGQGPKPIPAIGADSGSDEKKEPDLEPVDPEDLSVFVGGINLETGDGRLRDYFSKFGPLTKFNRPAGRGFCFLSYQTKEAVKKLTEVNLHILDNRQLDPKTARKDLICCRYNLSGLNPCTTSKSIKNYLELFGPVWSVTLKIDTNSGISRGFAFVQMASWEGWEKGLMHKPHILDGSVINVACPSNQEEIAQCYSHHLVRKNKALQQAQALQAMQTPTTKTTTDVIFQKALANARQKAEINRTMGSGVGGAQQIPTLVAQYPNPHLYGPVLPVGAVPSFDALSASRQQTFYNAVPPPSANAAPPMPILPNFLPKITPISSSAPGVAIISKETPNVSKVTMSAAPTTASYIATPVSTSSSSDAGFWSWYSTKSKESEPAKPASSGAEKSKNPTSNGADSSSSSSSSIPLHLEVFNLRSRQIFVTKIPIGMTRDNLTSYFSSFGAVEDVSMNIELTMSEAFVTFAAKESVQTVLSKGDSHRVPFLGEDVKIEIRHAFSKEDMKVLNASLHRTSLGVVDDASKPSKRGPDDPAVETDPHDPSSRDNRSVYVANLGDANAPDISLYFSQFGAVDRCSMKRSSSGSKEFCRVSFKSDDVAEMVCEMDHSLNGRDLIVDRWRHREEEEEKKRTVTKERRGEDRGYKSSRSHDRGGSSSHREESNSRKRLLVRGLTRYTNIDSLLAYFSVFGLIHDFQVTGSHKDYAYLTFSKNEAARNCMKKKIHYFSGHRLEVSEAASSSSSSSSSTSKRKDPHDSDKKSIHVKPDPESIEIDVHAALHSSPGGRGDSRNVNMEKTGEPPKKTKRY